MATYRHVDPDTGVVTEVDMTDDQARHLLDKGWIPAWTSPEVPDVTVDADSIISEHEDARP